MKMVVRIGRVTVSDEAEDAALRALDSICPDYRGWVGVDVDTPVKGGGLPSRWLDADGKIRHSLATEEVWEVVHGELVTAFRDLVCDAFAWRVSASATGIHLALRVHYPDGRPFSPTEAFYLRWVLADDIKRTTYDIYRAANSGIRYVEGVLFDYKVTKAGIKLRAGPWRNFSTADASRWGITGNGPQKPDRNGEG